MKFSGIKEMSRRLRAAADALDALIQVEETPQLAARIVKAAQPRKKLHWKTKQKLARLAEEKALRAKTRRTLA